MRFLQQQKQEIQVLREKIKKHFQASFDSSSTVLLTLDLSLVLSQFSVLAVAVPLVLLHFPSVLLLLLYFCCYCAMILMLLAASCCYCYVACYSMHQ
ncbi:unnamed protein product [Linum tenue]|uniref:Uncharacterized protein n=1 Tax=Linum tenue TaxID=586396 RepID=A0AAV0QDR2_9ROSI|nr:unnamed protein product [Linum tenue]